MTTAQWFATKNETQMTLFTDKINLPSAGFEPTTLEVKLYRNVYH